MRIGLSKSNNTFFTVLSITILLMVLTVSSSGQAFEEQDKAFYSMNFSAGYSTFRMKRAKDIFNKAKSCYSESNLNIPIQELFPGSMILGISSLFNVGSGFHTGFEIQFSSTGAVSSYRDIYGSLELKSTAQFIAINWLSREYFPAFSTLRPFAEAAFGISFGTFTINNKAEYNELSHYNFSKDITASGKGPSIQGAVGMEYSINNLISIDLKAGYNYIKTVKSSETIDFPGLGWVSIVSPIKVPELDFSGFTSTASISLQF